MTGPDFITRDGCRIVHRFDGPEDAPVLVLSNSLGTHMAMWEAQLPAWTRHARVLRYDQRGHGRSDAPAGGYSIDRLGIDLIELVDALGIATFDFCGLSLGGMTGQWLGIRAPERVRRLILANTSSYMGPADAWDGRIEQVRQSGMPPLVEASVSRWFTPGFAASGESAIAPIRSMLIETDPSGYAGCCAAIRDMDMRRTVSLVDIPTLVIGGRLDLATPSAHSEALASAIPGSKLSMIDAAHLSNVELPDQFGGLVTDFLA